MGWAKSSCALCLHCILLYWSNCKWRKRYLFLCKNVLLSYVSSRCMQQSKKKMPVIAYHNHICPNAILSLDSSINIPNSQLNIWPINSNITGTLFDFTLKINLLTYRKISPTLTKIPAYFATVRQTWSSEKFTSSTKCPTVRRQK